MPEENQALSLDEENPKPAGKKKLIIIIAAAVITLSIIGGAVFFFFLNDDTSPTEQAETTEVVVVEEPVVTNYVPMPRPLVFNVMEGKRDRTVQIKVQLMVNNAKSESLARKHIPLLESTLVRVFGEATVDQLRSPEGKKQLREKALIELNAATTQVESRELIHAVLFTGFVLQ
ncbi:flagellar basal body-associated protein FliL [Psychromonas sp.]|nr:flagellar basal body-associated protein FliL [Psychromonas sp.]